MSSLIVLTDQRSYHLYRKETDMRKGFNQLCGIITNELGRIVTQGDAFIFITIERICQEEQLSFEQIKEVRKLKSVRILRDLGLWLQQQYLQVLPKSEIGKAIGYSLERWERLSAYVNDGRLNIDNNPVENSIRPVALGRKNICLPAVMKQLSEVVCCTLYWVPAKCMG